MHVGTNDIAKEQLRKFIEAVAENEDYGIENYGYDATVDSITDSVFGKDDFAMLMDINATCIGDMVDAIQLFNEVNGTDYDGIVAPKNDRAKMDYHSTILYTCKTLGRKLEKTPKKAPFLNKKQPSFQKRGVVVSNS